MLDGSPYQGYLYAYPHKTAYRPLSPRPALKEVWAAEPRDSLFLYVHIPFCEMRCGFCNLFTRSNPPSEQAAAYLKQLRAQASQVADAIGPVRYSRAAIGGGTPTYLTADELTELFDLVALDPGVPLSVETSPATATHDRLQVLAAYGTYRVSMGVQSFLDAEAHAAGRPQRRSQVDQALEALRANDFPVLNLDLIYGIPGQTRRTWAESLRTALQWWPEEIYLYPLYVRPLTGLSRRLPLATDAQWDADRLDLYRFGRDLLREAGYRQLSMRQFRRGDVADPSGPDYCCQDDGMVGLGCGARSYTRELHYSFDYAVSIGEVRGIIDDYLARPADDFAFAEYGFALDAHEQRLRWLVKSLLRAEGADLAAYQARFDSSLFTDFPHLAELASRGWTLPLAGGRGLALTGEAASAGEAVSAGGVGSAGGRSSGTGLVASAAGRVVLSDEGLARSDSIGPWLVSGTVREMMTRAVLR